MADPAPIFVIGSGRSGTSLLRAMLNAHPRIYIVQEASFYSWVASVPRWIKTDKKLEFYFRSFSFAWLRLAPAEIRAAFPDATDSQLPDMYQFILRRVAERNGKMRYGEKNPLNTFFLGKLFEAFPGARVIDMVRDPRAQALSHTRMPWSTSSFIMLRRLFMIREKLIRPFADRVLRIRLEDLIADPRTVMSRILEYVGEDWDDAVLEHDKHADREDGIPFPWLTSANKKHKAVGGGVGAGWRDKIPAAWIRMIESANADMMAVFGYERAELEHEPKAGAKLAAWLADVPELFATRARRLRAMGRIIGYPPAGPAEGQRLICNSNPRAWRLSPEWQLPDPPEIITSA